MELKFQPDFHLGSVSPELAMKVELENSLFCLNSECDPHLQQMGLEFKKMGE